MRYFKYDDEYSQIGGGVTYAETDDEGWYFRQVTLNGDRYLASNINDSLWGLNLAEKPLPYNGLGTDLITEIAQEEFETVWHNILSQHEATWRRSQARYPLGSSIQGRLLIFYPQGVIIELDDETLGVADYAACPGSTTSENMYPRHRVTAIVSGYVEQQYWIALSEPQVQGDTL